MAEESRARKASRSGTRERIIRAAFSFYRDFVFEKVSLSMIAARVGISKPAIFKHFKTKDDLLEAMDDIVFSHLASVLQDVEAAFRDGRQGDALSRIIGYLAVNREETFYLVSTLPRITLDAIFMQLRRRGVNLFDNIFNPDGSVKDRDLYYLTVFECSTFLCFLLFWFSSEAAGPDSGADPASISSFISGFNAFVQGGLEGLGSQEPFDGLDAACGEGMSKVRPVNRTFTALVAVIERNGIKGVTVEGIASELGLAKSSLYSSFSSKEEMVRGLIDEELSNLYAAVLWNVRNQEGGGRRVYALMRTTMLYFISRPGIISVFQSLVLSGNVQPVKGPSSCTGACGSPLEGILALDFVPSLPDVGIPGFDRMMLISWFFALPTMLYMHCRVHAWGEDEMLLAVRRMYAFLTHGIGPGKASDGTAGYDDKEAS